MGQLAEQYGVRVPTIESIIHGRNWKHLPFVKPTKRLNAKLTQEQVIAIRVRRAAGERVAVLAWEYGVSRRTVRLIVHRHTWKHVA